MATKEEIQELLRFLSRDAKLSLKEAMSSIKALQEAKLTSVSAIAKAPSENLTSTFGSSASAKAVLAAAKRAQKKRALDIGSVAESPSKKRFASVSDELVNPDSLVAEESLLLPVSTAAPGDLEGIILETNRAPLVLAFATILLSYTYPHQPLSSRLSLAQAVVSANSRSKAVAIGLENRPSAEEEGWGQGQPRIKIMGREVRVLRRWNYEIPEADVTSSNASTLKQEDLDSRDSIDPGWTEATVPLWGLDTEKLRDANKSKASPDAAPTSALPIFTAQSARSYLLRSFATPAVSSSSTGKKTTGKELTAQKENNAALLLRALDLLVVSWKDTLGRDELDRRAWSWYVAVRPDVESGQKGWGEKGVVELSRILSMRRTAT